jgi:hypothetical protein
MFPHGITEATFAVVNGFIRRRRMGVASCIHFKPTSAAVRQARANISRGVLPFMAVTRHRPFDCLTIRDLAWLFFIELAQG